MDGYYYDQKINPKYELPGLWFNASELHALLAAYQLLNEVKPGFLEPHIAPLKQRILSTLKKEHYDQSELIMDILKYGPEVEVMGPASLRKEIINRIKQAENWTRQPSTR